EFFSYGASEPIATAHIEQGIQVNTPVAASLFENFENGFDANGWNVINAIITDANSPDGTSSARISTSPNSEGGPQSVADISALTGIPEDALDSLADDPGGPGNVTEGGAMVTTFSGQAGQIVSFDWFFSTQDYPNYNDIAFVAIDGEIVELLDVIASGNQAGNTTTEGWNTFSLALNTSGEHTIAFGVLDDSDTGVETSLNIDNIRLGPGGGGQPLHEGFENGFAANGWEAINATISPENSTEGEFSALLTTTAANEENNPDFVRTNAQEIANLAGVDVNDLDAIAETPDSPGFATEGSAIANSFYAMEGQIFSFDWFFSTYEYVEDDYGIVNDFAFIVIDGEIFELFDAEAVGNETDSVATEGWNSFSIVVDNSGYHDIAFGVLDNEDTVVESSLNIDNLRLEPGGNVPHMMPGLGNDIFISGDGDNIITTGLGADRIIFGGLNDGIDTITDFGDQDTLDLTGLLNGVFDPANVNGFVQATLFTDIAVLQGIGAGIGINVSIGDEDISVTSAVIV
ncbi:MAG: type I secretion C-terminal target domain-containing protein, partial [Alphaproteobacteria bacterium]